MTAEQDCIPATIQLPIDLMASVPWLHRVDGGVTLNLVVPSDYERQMKTAFGQSEVVGIQRLLTLARLGVKFCVNWGEGVANNVTSGASIFPMLAVLLLLRNASHIVFLANGKQKEMPLVRIRRTILKHRLALDLFSDTDILICDDGAGEALPADLYDLETLKLHPREDFETLVVEALTNQLGANSSGTDIYRSASALGRIVAELFENTDMHGKLDLEGRPLGMNSLRGLIFKRVKVTIPEFRPRSGASNTRVVDCFEASIFDSGIGYFTSYTRQHVIEKTSLIEEWKVLHNCLERHYYPDLQDHRAGHRALGLYEVLRAIQALKGRIEIRTGRLFAYRTFLEGELQTQMQPRAEFSRLAWPVPKLLDVGKKYVANPSENEHLIGASVRIIVPLT